MMIERALLVGLAAVLVGGCDLGEPVAKAPATAARSDKVAANPTAPPARPRTVPVSPRAPGAAGPNGVLTSIDPAKCDLITRLTEEAGYSRHRCFGVAGYRVEVVESDLRQNLELIRPDGTTTSLNLSSLVAGGGFSSLSETAEWRGADLRRPRTLTVRYGVNEDPDPAVAPRSYLVVIRLAAPACVVARIAPGPRQSEVARAVADSARLPQCLGSAVEADRSADGVF